MAHGGLTVSALPPQRRRAPPCTVRPTIDDRVRGFGEPACTRVAKSLDSPLAAGALARAITLLGRGPAKSVGQATLGDCLTATNRSRGSSGLPREVRVHGLRTHRRGDSHQCPDEPRRVRRRVLGVHLSSCGLVPTAARSYEIRGGTEALFPEDAHAQCAVWAVWRWAPD